MEDFYYRREFFWIVLFWKISYFLQLMFLSEEFCEISLNGRMFYFVLILLLICYGWGKLFFYMWGFFGIQFWFVMEEWQVFYSLQVLDYFFLFWVFVEFFYGILVLYYVFYLCKDSYIKFSIVFVLGIFLNILKIILYNFIFMRCNGEIFFRFQGQDKMCFL